MNQANSTSNHLTIQPFTHVVITQNLGLAIAVC